MDYITQLNHLKNYLRDQKLKSTEFQLLMIILMIWNENKRPKSFFKCGYSDISEYMGIHKRIYYQTINKLVTKNFIK